MLALFLAIIPSLLWDEGPDTASALSRAGIREIVTTAPVSRWQPGRLRVGAADPKVPVRQASGVDVRTAVMDAYANGERVYFRLKQEDLSAFSGAIRFLETLDDSNLRPLENAGGAKLVAGGEGVRIAGYASPSYSRLLLVSKSDGAVKGVCVRMPGTFGRIVIAIPGARMAPPERVAVERGATQFTVPEFSGIAVVNLDPAPAAVLMSLRSDSEFELSADRAAAQWSKAPAVAIQTGVFGEPLPVAAAEVRSRWTARSLYLLFSCPYNELFLKPGTPSPAETASLWTWEVAEAFIGADFDRIESYREYQVSPRGEWVDLDIDVLHPKPGGGMAWNSGFEVKARMDTERKIWFGEMRIPLASIAEREWRAGDRLRAGLFRILGPERDRSLAAWRPPYRRSFHIPEAFGAIVLAR